jgi:hypothetical protein
MTTGGNISLLTLVPSLSVSTLPASLPERVTLAHVIPMPRFVCPGGPSVSGAFLSSRAQDCRSAIRTWQPNATTLLESHLTNLTSDKLQLADRFTDSSGMAQGAFSWLHLNVQALSWKGFIPEIKETPNLVSRPTGSPSGSVSRFPALAVVNLVTNLDN